MKGTVVLAILAVLGYVSAQDAESNHQNRQRRDKPYLTTPTATTDLPTPSTTISLSPQTSISVHHSIVRNKPAYPYPYTDVTMQPEGTEDTSYYYTYEDVSDDVSKHGTSTITPMTTVRPTVKSFWNSQKALLDARRKEGAQKFVPTYSKPSSAPKETKPPIEFKSREKPKFGLANKSKQFTTTKKPEITTPKTVELSTTSKAVKSDVQFNLPIQNLSEKDLLKTLKDINLLPNQIIGRTGDIPIQNNMASQIQSPLRAQSSNVFRPSKFDNTLRNVQFVDNARPLQPPSLGNTQNQPGLQNNMSPAAFLNSLAKLNQQRSAPINQQTANSQTLLNLNQQPLINNLNQVPGSAFISASPAVGTSGRSAEAGIKAASSLLQRLGALGLGGNAGNANNVVGRDGGYGGGDGFTLNLGPVPDPLSFFLKLLSLIPRPLLDLNGKIFFGIELGKNAGIVSGTGGSKPYSG